MFSLTPGGPKRTVRTSEDFRRVSALPRRAVPSDFALAAMGRDWTERLRTPAGGMRLRPVQGWALDTVAGVGGMLGIIGVGWGKTLVAWLAPTVWAQARRPLVMLPASLREQFLADGNRLRQHWRIRGDVQVVSYEALSQPRTAGVLEALRPDLIVCDEAHHLRGRDSARTRRFLRYFASAPDTRLVAMSGTLTSRSIRDWAHLAALALRDGAPVPFDVDTLTQWAGALDEGLPPTEVWAAGVLKDWAEPGETLRDGFRRRVIETPGVVSTSADALGTGLEVYLDAPHFPDIAAAIQRLAFSSQDPDGNEVDSPLEFSRVARQLGCGFWYRWVWPGGVPDFPWLESRNRWNHAVRQWLETGPGAGLDSPAMVVSACESGNPPTDALAAAWDTWATERQKSPPPSVPVWYSRAVVEYARDWVRDGGVVWYADAAVADALAEAGVPVFGPGTAPELYQGAGFAASIRAHGTGKNLQRWSRNLVLTPPSAGDVWEQLLGRTHRPGQAADTVWVHVLVHHATARAAFDTARGEAKFIESTLGTRQKLNCATIVAPNEV